MSVDATSLIQVKVLRAIPPITLDQVVLGQYVADPQGMQAGCVSFRSRVHSSRGVCCTIVLRALLQIP
jgi:hypothetical protein